MIQLGSIIRNQWLDHGVLLAVSGGADSVAMFRIFLESIRNESDRERLAVGHVNHRLRGEESDGDAVFVRELAARFGCRFFEHRIDPDEWTSDKTGSREAAARNIRYRFLIETAERLGFRYIATAHTADDQTETVLHRILRGTGLIGLAGISSFRQLTPAITAIRPLLEFRRNDILEYLKRLNQPFRTDSSNLENDFTRNKIRNELLPKLRNDYNPKVDEALNRLASIAGETESIFDDMMSFLAEQVVKKQSPAETVIDAILLRKRSPATVARFFIWLWRQNGWSLREMGQFEWSALVEFLDRDRPRQKSTFPDRIVAEYRDDYFILRPDAADSAE